ncbi:FecR family protein [Maribacter ulvicola]|uniref:FecR family protein n=1 Tax=Maribacter ulvicola TaxID=228959 RepID=A0A1N6Y969_9FLAO|nr:FecR domain-containing protein [Maribacter ulvicola]SIR11185.1 FecR family protein [Maribacter ulvicola]
MKKVIDKYLSDSINELEIEQLKVWLQKEKNRLKFEDIVKSHYQINLGLQEVDLDKEYLTLLKALENRTYAKKRVYNTWYKRAAIFVGLIGLSSLMFFISSRFNGVDIDENTITIRQDNGDIQVIDEHSTIDILDDKGNVIGQQKGAQLNYTGVVSESAYAATDKKLKYNELIVPYGKKMKLVLSDSTVVHMNSGTTFKYPVKFLKDGVRKVYLTGEAFFEVSESKSNSFIVSTSEIDIRVLGTKFDVSSYTDDKAVSAVLVEGSVELYKSGSQKKEVENYVLEPGQMASWNKSIANMNITEVDIHEYTSWVNGKIIFQVRPFKEIIKVLERHYDVAITNNYKALDNQQFFAKFDTETIEQVMTYFQSSIPFSYTRKGDEIIINQP